MYRRFVPGGAGRSRCHNWHPTLEAFGVRTAVCQEPGEPGSGRGNKSGRPREVSRPGRQIPAEACGRIRRGTRLAPRGRV